MKPKYMITFFSDKAFNQEQSEADIATQAANVARFILQHSAIIFSPVIREKNNIILWDFLRDYEVGNLSHHWKFSKKKGGMFQVEILSNAVAMITDFITIHKDRGVLNHIIRLEAY